MRRFAPIGRLTLISVLAIGCGSHVARGQTLYADGKYVEAAHVFDRTEYRLDELSASERAEYGLYRGLTLMALGDFGQAHQWFAFAYEMDRRSPGALDGDQRALADRAWFALLRRMGEAPQKSSPNAAVAQNPPAPPAGGPAMPPGDSPSPLETSPGTEPSFVGP